MRCNRVYIIDILSSFKFITKYDFREVPSRLYARECEHIELSSSYRLYAIPVINIVQHLQSSLPTSSFRKICVRVCVVCRLLHKIDKPISSSTIVRRLRRYGVHSILGAYHYVNVDARYVLQILFLLLSLLCMRSMRLRGLSLASIAARHIGLTPLSTIIIIIITISLSSVDPCRPCVHIEPQQIYLCKQRNGKWKFA